MLLSEDAFAEHERWAWNLRLCLGQIADMSDYRGGDGKECNPKDANAWPDTRRLSEKFLLTILFHEPFKSAPPRPQTHIKCALFGEEIDISNFGLESELWFDDSRFRKNVDLVDLNARRSVSFTGSVFDEGINLLGAKMGGQLIAWGSTFEGLFIADGLEVKGDLFLGGGANFKKEVRLVGAKISGQLNARGATFEGLFTAEGLEVTGGLLLDQGASFKEGINLIGAKIGGAMTTRGDTFEGWLQADGLEVKGLLFLDQGADFRGPIDFLGGLIEGNVHLDGSTFHQLVDFTGTTITGDLILASHSAGSVPPTWKDGAKLILRNVSAGALQESSAAWCKEGRRFSCNHHYSQGFVPVDLKGFTHQRLGGVESTGTGDPMAARKTGWLLAWIGAQSDHGSVYNPQPFTQLAAVLREAGNPAKADDILYYRREHERTAANTPWWSKFWLTVQWLLIGYGYASWRALIPFAGLVLAGVYFCGRANETTEFTTWRKIWYSLDRALPIIDLGATEDIKPLSNWVAAYYFYAHHIAGFILATFLVAGLTGFTK